MSERHQKFVDDKARKPAGLFGRFLYSVPIGHYATFHITLRELDLQPDDIYLEVAQGGGVLLKRALRTVKKAAAIDHSPDMVEAAKKNNSEAVKEGRVEILQGDAEAMTWADGTFTCAACTEAFFFFEHPVAVLKEIYRVLKDSGRFVLATTPKSESRLVKAILTPYRSDMRLYTDSEMVSMLEEAGFVNAEVRFNNNLRQICYAEKSTS